MRISKRVFILVLVLLPLGQLTRFEVAPNVAIYHNDLLIPLLLLIWFFEAGAIRKKFFIPPFSLRLIVFTTVAFLSLLVGSQILTNSETLISGLFLIRFIEYAALYFIGYELAADSKFREKSAWVLILAGFIVALLGFLQFIVIPDFAQLASEGGWDPHQYRLLSTFFDPNFVGGFLVFLTSYIISFLFWKKKQTEKIVLTIFGLSSLLAIVLTFSRSTYLAFFAMLFAFGSLRSSKIFLPLISLVAAVFILIPPVQSRLVQAINLDDSARARLISWDNAVTIANDNSFLGVGFNSYRFAQERYGFFQDAAGGGHSGSGVDSSVLLVLATTGILGLLCYLWLLFGLLQLSFRQRHDMLSLAFLVGFLSLIVHSVFVNSLFYPQMMAIFWVGAALMASNHERKKYG